MFAMQRDRSSSGSSTRSNSSARSLSLSPRGWSCSKATASPATTTTTPFGHTPSDYTHDYLAPLHSNHRKLLSGNASSRRHETFAPDSAYNSYAYPCWPAGDSLGHRRTASRNQADASHIATVYSGNHYAIPSSRISDDDLEGLDFSKSSRSSRESTEEIQGGISWSQVGANAPPAAYGGEQRRRRLPPPPAGGCVVVERERRGSRKSSSTRKVRAH